MHRDDSHTQFVCLLYDSRSGSTLLSALLNRYCGVSVSQESAFIPNILEHPRELHSNRLNAFLNRLEREVQFQELRLDHSAILRKFSDVGPIERADLIVAILSEYFSDRDPDASLWVIKSPRMIFHAKRFLQIFPETLFVHIVRDGRAVFNSKRAMRSVDGRLTQNNLIKAASDWRKRIRMSRALGSAQIEVRYEKLIESPEEELEVLLDFFRLERQRRRITKDQAEYANTIGDRQQHLHKNVFGKPDINIASKWQHQLLPEDVLLYEWLAGDQLKALGYPLVYISENTSGKLRFKAMWRFVYYVLHQGWKYLSNLYWYIFVDRTILEKFRAKLYEVRS